MAWAQVRQTLHIRDGYIRFCIPSYYEIVCIEDVYILMLQWQVSYANIASYLICGQLYIFTFELDDNGGKL